ncbi:MAG: efflux transporter outer membrane subunit [Planctomycetes bacterium]|nr:efflux transporter outer membrane subunit [Planctomycetota bacterium]
MTEDRECSKSRSRSRHPLPSVLCPVLGLLLLSGCAVGPSYHRPETPVPESWAETSDTLTAAPPSMVQWWTVFNDAQLDALVDRAIRSNRNLRLAEARILQARAQRIVAAAAGLPMLNATGAYTRLERSRNAFSSATGDTSGTGGTAGGAGAFGPGAFGFGPELFQAGFDATWEIDVFGGVRRAVEAANANIGAAQENFRDTLVTLLGEVATNYFQIRGSQRRIAVALENMDIQRKTVELTRGQFQAGLSNRLQVVQAEALLATTESQIPPLETTVKQSTYQLGLLIGTEPETLLQELSRASPMPPPPPAVPAGLPSDLLRRRPDIRRAERQLAAATAQIGVAVADLFPKLSLTGAYGYQSTTTSTLFSSGSQYWSVGPGLTLPLFRGGQIRGNIQVQRALEQQALATYENTVLTALQDVESSIAAYAEAQAARASLARAVSANQEATQISQDLYEKGLTDFLNVLQSEGSLYQAQDRLIQNNQLVLTSLVALFKALGGGWEMVAPEARRTEGK